MVAENPEVRTPEGKPSPSAGGLGEGVPALAGAGGALTANLFTLRVRGREEARVELAVLRRGYSVQLRLRTYDHVAALEVYRRLLQLLEDLGFEELRLGPRNLKGIVYLPRASEGG